MTKSSTKSKNTEARYVIGSSRNHEAIGRFIDLMARDLADEDEARAQRIKDLRKAKRLTQPELADKVGVSLRAAQEWEYGGGIDRSHEKALARALGVSVDVLLHGRPSENHNNSGTTPPSVEQRLEAMQREIERLTEYVRRAIPPSE
jgi:transcriptional regulator with XRE-family HTH domain